MIIPYSKIYAMQLLIFIFCRFCKYMVGDFCLKLSFHGYWGKAVWNVLHSSGVKERFPFLPNTIVIIPTSRTNIKQPRLLSARV